MRISTLLLAAGLTLFAAGAMAQSGSSEGPYKVIKKAKVGGEGGFDYVYADSVGRRLYVPRSGAAGRVVVYDLDNLTTVGVIADARGVHGAAVDPKSGHGFCSSNPVVMWDTKTLKTIKTIPVQGNPDGIFFEPFTERIYILSHNAPNVTAIDAKTGDIAGTIDLGGAPEQGQSDGKGMAYIDIEDGNNVAAVDTKTMKVTAHFDFQGKGGGAAGLGLDAKNGILFAMCRNPQNCVIMSAKDGKVLDSLPIGSGTDGGGFNPDTMEAFSSQGDGTLTIIKEESPTSFKVEQNVTTMSRGKTCTLDSKTGHILIIAAENAAAAARGAAAGGATGGAGAGAAADQAGGRGARGGRGRRGGRGGRGGAMVPNSFTIVEVGK